MKEHSSLFVNWINVVIVAHNHNPSILNPDFLILNKIVSDTWEVSENITTPPFSMVKYKNNVNFTITENRLEVKEEINAFELPKDSDIYNIITNYIKLLPHVPYKSFGLNWSFIYIVANPKDWIINNLIDKKYSSENNKHFMLANAGVLFCYDLQKCVCNIKINPHEFTSNKKEYAGINFDFNFSHTLNNQHPCLDQINEEVKSWKALQDIAIKITEDIVHR